MSREANLAMLELAALHLGDVRQEVAFLGGCAVALLLMDTGAPEVRATRDIDVIVEVGSQTEYYTLGERLRRKGFAEDQSEDAPVCRWRGHGITLDVMPTDSAILGFSNKWYVDALRNALNITLPSGADIRAVSAPHFVATKLEAFAGRGAGDLLGSHDLEDIIAVIDGRPELIEEVAEADAALRKYVAAAFSVFLADPAFTEALPGHLPGDAASQQRLPILMERIRGLAALA